MESFSKIVGAAIIVAIAAFVYVFGRGKDNKKLVDTENKNSLSYEDIIDDLKLFLAKNKDKFSGTNLKMQILSKETVVRMSDYLSNEGIDINLSTTDRVGLIVLANNNPVYIKLYSYKELAQDLLDVLPEKGIYEQNIDI